MRAAVDAAVETMRRAGGSRVMAVELVLGASGHVTEEIARQYFELFAAGTPAAGADITIVWLPATYQCFGCLNRFHSASRPEEVDCPICGGVALEIAHEDVCAVRSVEVTFDEAEPPAVEASLLTPS
jgi:Zn finger protein HypA/HybF involved in hydrogenase expression